MKTFTVTKEHILLLKNLQVEWSDVEFGAPEIDPKRPYGNSDVIRDIAEIIYGPKAYNEMVDEDGLLPAKTEDKLCNLHKDMQTVLQICVFNNGVKAKTYVLKDKYGSDWKEK
jgi:hypothetical protein